MSKDHEGHIKGYTLDTLFTPGWIHDGNEVAEVMFGFYAPTGGTSGEMSMRWHLMMDSHIPYPRLEVFSDGWHALSQLGDVLEILADLDDQDITPEQFCALLEQCGFVDRHREQ